MSRPTRRQVSEDHDLDSLLSTLSPEEVEELQKDMIVTDLDPRDGRTSVQREGQPPITNNVQDTKMDTREESDRKTRLSRREQSFEVWLQALPLY